MKKNNKRESSIVRLAETNVRNDSAFDRQYLDGKFDDFGRVSEAGFVW